MDHPVDVVVHVVGFVVGDAVAKRGMQNSANWFLWIVVVILVLAVFFDGGATYKQMVKALGVDQRRSQSAAAFEVLRNLGSALQAVLAWVVIRTMRTLVNWMLGIEDAAEVADDDSSTSMLPYLFLGMIITAMFAIIEALGFGRSGKIVPPFKGPNASSSSDSGAASQACDSVGVVDELKVVGSTTTTAKTAV